jgi:hypothetical protein
MFPASAIFSAVFKIMADNKLTFSERVAGISKFGI